MEGDPIDPVTFHRAARELFERLAAHEGIDLEAFHDEDYEASPAAQAKHKQTDVWGSCATQPNSSFTL